LLGVSQVNEAVSHMDGVTQQNAAMVEQLAAAFITMIWSLTASASLWSWVT
jgi:aerotaxis receptor